MLYMIASLSSRIEEWNEKLNDFTAQYSDNAAFATLIVICLLILGYWAIGYLSKK